MLSRAIFDEFRASCQAHSDQILIFEQREADIGRFTYAEILRETEILSRYLAAFSFSAGTRVAILSENRREWVAAYMASVSMGLCIVPLDPQLQAGDWKRVLDHSGAEFLFVSEKFRSAAEGLARETSRLKRVVLFGDAETENPFESYERLLKKDAGGPPAERPVVDVEALASLVYTSGTTGEPKGVMLSHANLLSNAYIIHPSVLGPGGVAASILPLNHIYGFTTFLGAVLCGESIVFYRVLNHETLYGSFKALRPHILLGVPSLFERIARSVLNGLEAKLPKPAFKRLQKALDGRLGKSAATLGRLKRLVFGKVREELGGRIRYCGSGGAPLETNLVKLFNFIGLPIYEGYGLTETSPLVALANEKNFRLGSVGRPVAGVEVRIDRPDDAGVGEIWVRSPGVMKGYFLHPEATREMIDGEGWFHTGDLGSCDAAGFLSVSGRIKEVIVTSNGKNVYPPEVEAHFRKLPFIKELCVFGVARGQGHRGEIVHLQVVADRAAAEAANVSDVLTAIRGEVTMLSMMLPAYKRPMSIGFSEEPFPRSGSLKIKKYQVKEKWLRGEGGGKAGKEPAGDPLLKTPTGSKVAVLLRSLLPKHMTVTSSSSFDMDLTMDSLTLIEFFASVEKAFAVKIPEAKLAEIQDVGALILFLAEAPASGETVASPKSVETDWGTILEADAEKNRKIVETVLAERRVLRPVFLSAFKWLFRRLSRLEVKGLENLPADGAFVLAPNHECYVDNIFVASVMPRRVRDNMAVIGAKEFFDQWFTRAIAKLCRTIPVDRKRVAGSVLQAGRQVLKQGKVLLIHPEGTRSPDGHLLPLKTGAALLAHHARCPLVPVYIEGAHEFWPKGAKLPKSRSRITVTIGEAILPGSPENKADRSEAALMTEELNRRLAALAEGKSPVFSARKPSGWKSGALAAFDVDGTLVRSTVLDYYVFLIGGIFSGWKRFLKLSAAAVRAPYWLLMDRFDRPRVIRSIYGLYRGLPADRLRGLAALAFEKVMRPELNHSLLAKVEEHRRRGDRIVLVSGALDFLLEPLAHFLRADTILGTALEEKDGRFTGRAVGNILIGEAKKEALLDFAREHGCDLSVSHAYADDFSDLPILECVGHPVAVNPRKKLRRVADHMGWETIRFGFARGRDERPLDSGPSKPPETLRDVFFRSSRQFQDRTAFEQKGEGGWRSFTYGQFEEEVNRLSSYLLKNGLRPSETVAILSENRLEWCAAFFAAVNVGGVCVPLDTNLSGSELVSLLRVAEPRVLFTSRKHLGTVLKAREEGGSPLHVVCFDPVRPEFDLVEWAQAREQPYVPFDFNSIPVGQDDGALLFFTSGTTGQPKGVLLTHRNITNSAWWTWKETAIIRPDSKIFGLLPLFHIFPVTVGMIVPYLCGATFVMASTLKPHKLMAEICESRPTTLLGVPLILDSLYRGVLRGVAEQTALKRAKFKLALWISKIWPSKSPALRRSLFRPIQDKFGGRVEYVSCGGAALDGGIQKSLERLGWVACVGYGLTETAPVIATNTPHDRRAGSVGRPLPHMEVRIARPDVEGVGEIQVKGVGVMKEYYRSEEMTRAAFEDGWFRTGDLGCLDKDGFLHIRGRCKDVIVTPGGKKVYPEDLENLYQSSPMIKDICIFEKTRGDGRFAGLHALVVPSAEVLTAATPHKALEKELERLSEGLPLYKRLASFDVSNEDLAKTSLRKTKRHVVIQKHGDQIRSATGE